MISSSLAAGNGRPPVEIVGWLKGVQSGRLNELKRHMTVEDNKKNYIKSMRVG